VKTRLTPEVQRQICAHVAQGAPIPHACEAAGIPWYTCKDWLRKGRAGQKPYAAFVAAVEKAKGKCVAAMTKRVAKASALEWRAAAWWLEKRVEEFRPPPQQTELTLGGNLEVTTTAKASVAAKLDELRNRHRAPKSG
jgi:hypothetical protein